jgi:hypothetical protein
MVKRGNSDTISCHHPQESHDVPIISLAPDLVLFGISDKFELDDVVLGQKLGEGIKNNRMSDRMSDR